MMKEVKSRRFTANMEPTDGIKVVCDCCEFTDHRWNSEKRDYDKTATDTFDIKLDMSRCDQKKIHGDIEIRFPDGSELSIYSATNTLSYSYEAANGATVYQELTPPKYCKKCGKECE